MTWCKADSAVQAFLLDERMNSREQTWVAEDLQVGLKNLGCRGSQLLGNPVHQALELGFGLFHGSIEIRDLGGNLGGVFEGLGFAQT